MSDRNTIEILRKSIAAWIDSAEAALQQAAHERREAIAFSKRFEDISAVLPMSQCPFCGGQMVDTAPLQVFGDELRVMQQYLFQNEWFTLHCLACVRIAPMRRVTQPSAGRRVLRRCGARSSRQIFSEYFRTRRRWP